MVALLTVMKKTACVAVPLLYKRRAVQQVLQPQSGSCHAETRPVDWLQTLQQMPLRAMALR